MPFALYEQGPIVLFKEKRIFYRAYEQERGSRANKVARGEEE